MTHLAPLTNMKWEAVGEWLGGTVVGVALEDGVNGRGLLASRAGVYGWTQPSGVVESLVAGLTDLNVVAVAFAGGTDITHATALAATATGRLFRLVGDRRRLANDPVDLSVHISSEKWQELSSWAGLGVAVVLAPSPDFADDQTLFVGTPNGIYRTQDDGQSWESCNFGLLDEDVLCLACAPDFAESELLWAGTAAGGLYRSRNSGRAWRESGYGLPDAAVQSLAVSPNFVQDRTLFVGMEAHGVYVSRDGGENWVSLGLANYSVNTLACPRADLLWAGIEDGLWRLATANGETTRATGAGEVVLSVAASPEGHLAAGLFGRGLWLAQEGMQGALALEWHNPALTLHAPPVIVTANSELFALDSDGFMARSQDGGVAWVEMESASAEGFFALNARVAHPTLEAENGNTTLYAATATGLSRWDGRQELWQVASDETSEQHTLVAVELSPTFGNDQMLLAMTQAGELLLSHDGGTTLHRITGPWQGLNLLHAHFAAGNANEIVVLTLQPTESGHLGVMVWQTPDLAQSWEMLASFTTSVPAVMLAWPHDPVERALFMATQHRVVKLYHQAEPSALQFHQHFFNEALRVTGLAVAPDYAVSGIIWAATTEGIYRSVDRGMSWGLMVDLPLDLPLVWLEVTFTHLHAITLGGRVWRAHL